MMQTTNAKIDANQEEIKAEIKTEMDALKTMISQMIPKKDWNEHWASSINPMFPLVFSDRDEVKYPTLGIWTSLNSPLMPEMLEPIITIKL